jgi:hypothetical protein
MAASGQINFPPNLSFVGRTILRAGAVQYVPPRGCKALRVTCYGGGGGGGGSLGGAAGTASAGSGGSSGSKSETLVTSVDDSRVYPVAIGAGGAGGVAGNNPGANGGDTTFDNPSVCTALGGNPGAGGGAADVTLAFVVGALPIAPSAVADLSVGGYPGGASIRLSGTVALSGHGGPSLLGSRGGAPQVAQSGGSGGQQQGAGGGGALSLNGGASAAGGAGSPGLIIIEEYA